MYYYIQMKSVVSCFVLLYSAHHLVQTWSETMVKSMSYASCQKGKNHCFTHLNAVLWRKRMEGVLSVKVDVQGETQTASRLS